MTFYSEIVRLFGNVLGKFKNESRLKKNKRERDKRSGVGAGYGASLFWLVVVVVVDRVDRKDGYG